MPAGFAADGAYWIDSKTARGLRRPTIAANFPNGCRNSTTASRAEKYLNLEWKDADGKVLRTTKIPAGKHDFYGVVGTTPYANDYELDFARDLITYEKLGSGAATDFLSVSLSANDILGHEVGPDHPRCEPWRWRSTGSWPDSSISSDISLVLPMSDRSFGRSWRRTRTASVASQIPSFFWSLPYEKMEAKLDQRSVGEAHARTSDQIY